MKVQTSISLSLAEDGSHLAIVAHKGEETRSESDKGAADALETAIMDHPAKGDLCELFQWLDEE